MPGHGATGEDDALDSRPTKRAGLNRYEDDQGLFPGVDYLVYDFDSGLEANTALAQTGFASDLGFGENEVLLGSGDSGAPTFIGDVIAGVASSTMRLPSADVTDETDSSWGEGGFDVRVSGFREFILDATGGAAVFVTTPAPGDINADGAKHAHLCHRPLPHHRRCPPLAGEHLSEASRAGASGEYRKLTIKAGVSDRHGPS